MSDNADSNSPVALVTGASRGIGSAIAERLAAEGYRLTVSARSPESLETRAQELRDTHGVEVVAQAADVTSDEALIELATKHIESYGRLDVLVLNAGMGHKGSIVETPLRKVDRLYQVNLRSQVLMLQQLLPTMRETAGATGAAKVVALASISGVFPERDLSAYSATKAAFVSMCQSVNLEESGSGVAATAICPGYVATDMTDWLEDTMGKDQMITPNDIAEVALMVTKLSRSAVIPQVVVTRPGDAAQRA